MSERLDAMIAREYTDRDGNKKSSFTKIGVAFPMRNGGWSVSLEALPLPIMGERGMETRILLMPPRQDKAPASAHPSQFATQQSAYEHDELSDEVPF